MLLRRAYKIHINLDSVAYVELCAYMEWRCVEQKPVRSLLLAVRTRTLLL